MPSEEAVIADLERIPNVAEAGGNDTDEPGDYKVHVRGHRFTTEWLDMCEWEYGIRSVDTHEGSDLHLHLDQISRWFYEHIPSMMWTASILFEYSGLGSSPEIRFLGCGIQSTRSRLR